MNTALSRLRWRCRRGMRELDLPLLRYLERDYRDAEAAERAAFERLLEESEHDLWRYFYHSTDPADPALADLVRKLRHALAARP